MQFSENHQSWLNQLNEANARFFDTVRGEASTELHQMLLYQFSTGGKRLRALATLNVADFYLQNIVELQPAEAEKILSASILPVALAVEHLHNATLVHDDIQDGDEFRRGEPTVWKKFSVAQAINCGDYLFFTVDQLIDRSDLEVVRRHELTTVFSECTRKVINGQSLEFEMKQRFARGEIAENDYVAMVNGKTTALFHLPVFAGAIAAGAEKSELEALRPVIRELGVRFQMQDDYQDIWGSKGRETPARDIAEGKVSFPVILLLDQLSAADRTADADFVREVVLRDRALTGNEEIGRVVALMNEVEIEKAVLTRLRDSQFLEHCPEAWRGLFDELYELTVLSLLR